jgi:hypothetical protein
MAGNGHDFRLGASAFSEKGRRSLAEPMDCTVTDTGLSTPVLEAVVEDVP